MMTDHRNGSKRQRAMVSLVCCAGAMVVALLCPGLLGAQEAPVKELVRPSQANPAVHRFDEENVVLTPRQGFGNVPLALFLPGTHGKPLNAARLLNVVAGQGCRVIGLLMPGSVLD